MDIKRAKQEIERTVKAYLAKDAWTPLGDQVAVLDTSTPGWYQVLFASGSAPVKGWVSADYLVLL